MRRGCSRYHLLALLFGRKSTDIFPFLAVGAVELLGAAPEGKVPGLSSVRTAEADTGRRHGSVRQQVLLRAKSAWTVP
jgi:hypothetical protein